MKNYTVISRIFGVSFARQEKKISASVNHVLFSVTRRDFHCIPNGLRQPFVTALPQNSCACQTAWKHSSKFSRGKGEKEQAVDQNNDDDDDSSADISELDPGILSDVDGKDIRIMTKKLNSLRLDSLLKAGLGIAKNKIDTAFYESKIRVNGEKLLKKSKRMEVGDEVDLIKGSNVINPAFLDVGRVVVLSADYASDMEKVTVVLKRYRSLTIENYPNPYKTGSS